MKASYRMGPLLGAGGMAEVYLGQAEGAGGFVRPVAIKRVREPYAKDHAFLDAFTAEARLAAKLSHPNIVSVSDYQIDETGSPFLVMEYVEGRDLAALVSTGALPCSVAIFVISEMLRGLAYAHQLPVSTGLRGVVHRDISPHNVLLSWQGEVKVSDFGIAKAFTTTQGAFSTTVRGKPCYMSPEQISVEPLDGRSDLFAVGTVFWELLVGRRAFEGVTYRETLARVTYSPIPSLRGEAPQHIGADVEAVVMKLLARDKNQRYATAQEAIADLIRCDASPKDGVGELVALMQHRLRGPAQQELHDAPSLDLHDPAAALWPGPLLIRTVTSVPAERRTKTLDVPAAPAPQLGAALASGGRITTGPNDATIAGPLPASLPAAPLPPAAVTIAPVPLGAPWTAIDSAPQGSTWRKRRQTIALASVALVCALAASLLLRSKPGQRAPAPEPAAQQAAPGVLALPSAAHAAAVAADPTANQARPMADESPVAGPLPRSDVRGAAAALETESDPGIGGVSRAERRRAERGQHRPASAGRDTARHVTSAPTSEIEPQPTPRRRIIEVDLGASALDASKGN